MQRNDQAESLGAIKPIKLMSIAGARPNFMKLASIARAVENHNQLIAGSSGLPRVKHVIVHTGQHYDQKMSHSFFDELVIPKPDINLEVGSGSHAAQTAEIMKRFDAVLLSEQPDVLLVVGDVNSTVACALVAAKIEYPVGHCRRRPLIVHVEAGLRSFDRDMPEEINRIVTDSLSDMLFVTEESGLVNLHSEGVPATKMFFVGNVMIDTLIAHLQSTHDRDVIKRLDVKGGYGLVTLHRPSNVDSLMALRPLLETLVEISHRLRLIFPAHPRTMTKIKELGLSSMVEQAAGITICPPFGYLDFLCLMRNARLVLTDSGGLQEETTYLRIPCVTLRENTERPVTVTCGSNYLVGVVPSRILEIVDQVLCGQTKAAQVPPLWDGKAGDRIIRAILEYGGGLA